MAQGFSSGSYRARNPAYISNLMSFKVLTGVIILKCKSYSKYKSNFSRTSTIIPNITTSASRIFHGSFKYFFSPGDHKVFKLSNVLHFEHP